MSFLTPGRYLRTKLVRTHYDVRADKGERLLLVAAHEASTLISKGLVLGKLSPIGELQYLAALKSKKALQDALKQSSDCNISAEDNTTTERDGRGYKFHARRVLAWAR